VLHQYLSLHSDVQQSIIHTGQHYSYSMNELFFEELSIPTPDINFNIQHSSPNGFIGLAADALQQFFVKEQNAAAFVYGDTNSTLAAALAATRTHTPLLHFEAGVRTGDNSMPEEINRLLTDRLANINFCCTQNNLNNLLAEGYGSSIPCKTILSGDLMLDAFLKIAPGKISTQLPDEFILCTIHRAANLSDKNNLAHIIDALNQLHQQTAVVMPIHPHTQKKIESYGLAIEFIALPPVGYPQMKSLLQRAVFVITDSGGTSREAYFSNKPSLIIMNKPFWPEIIEAGCALQSIAHKNEILKNVQLLNNLPLHFNSAIFGNGNAAAMETLRQALAQTSGFLN